MEADLRTRTAQFLASSSFAVIGASKDVSKFGHKVYAAYLRHGRRAFPINPRAETVLGNPAYPSLTAVSRPVEAVSIVTPPAVTTQVMDEVIASGARHVWMQPGASSPEAVRKAEAAGLNVIHGGPCVLVELARG